VVRTFDEQVEKIVVFVVRLLGLVAVVLVFPVLAGHEIKPLAGLGVVVLQWVSRVFNQTVVVMSLGGFELDVPGAVLLVVGQVKRVLVVQLMAELVGKGSKNLILFARRNVQPAA
jgi:hypothetical protein